MFRVVNGSFVIWYRFVMFECIGRTCEWTGYLGFLSGYFDITLNHLISKVENLKLVNTVEMSKIGLELV